MQYACDQCDYKDTKEESLNDHKHSQHEIRNYQSKQCDYKAVTRSGLNDHEKSIHNKQPEVTQEARNTIKKPKYISKRIPCSICAKKFNKKETFEAHMKKYHGKK